MSRKLSNTLLIIMLIIGLALLSYPSIADYWNQFHQSKAILSYSGSVDKMSQKECSEKLESARDYNRRLAEKGIQYNMSESETEAYNRELAIDDSGIMGYISIPKFHIRLPIYHGTEETVLQNAVGHMEYTSLPVGGESTHTQISGHRGLPSARLFTDIDKIREGDTWTITVLNETLTYECDMINIVEPGDLTKLQIIEGEDLCTLITCTPYGINTHRLLVRGHRVPNVQGSEAVSADAVQVEPEFVAVFLMIPLIIILVVIMMISTRKAKSRR